MILVGHVGELELDFGDLLGTVLDLAGRPRARDDAWVGLELLLAILVFDYQSECHCSKTHAEHVAGVEQFDYQSECHCSKTHQAAQ